MIAVGLGKRDEFDPERARIAAAVAIGRRAERRRAQGRLRRPDGASGRDRARR